MRTRAVAFMLLAACGVSSKVEMTARPPHPLSERGFWQVDVLDDMPSRPHADIARIHSGRTNRPGFNSIPRNEAIAELRRAGGKLGCDAVVVLGEEYSKGHRREGVLGACIVYIDGPPGLSLR